MKILTTFGAGLIFGIGLILSGMSNPANVIQFLDIIGVWNPSLAFVMLGAISVSYFGFRWIETNTETLFSEPLHLPGKSHINKELIIGSILFGAGWAIAGFCPGPALVSIGAGQVKGLVFLCAMVLGMWLHDSPYSAFIQHRADAHANT